MTILCMLIPFLGRTAIGWIVDVNTIGAVIAYIYTSASALTVALREKNRAVAAFSIFGIVMSVIFFFYFMSWSANAMSTESYLILTIWSLLGFLYFRYVFSRDEKRRFGKSTIVWISLMFLIFFTSLMWVRKATDEMTQIVADNISVFYEQQNTGQDPEKTRAAEAYIADQLKMADHVLTRNNIIEIFFIVLALAILLSIYRTITARERQMEVEKLAVEKNSRMKAAFLSDMSHYIRTPVSVIAGSLQLSDKSGTTPEKLREYVMQAKGASEELLEIVDNVIEMSRMESGSYTLKPVRCDLKELLSELYGHFLERMNKKQIDFSLDTEGLTDSIVLCDKEAVKRIVKNLLSNALHFTSEGGTVLVSARQREQTSPGEWVYVIRVADSGIGMNDAEKENLFLPFERGNRSAGSQNSGVGLGMAVVKGILQKIHGEILVKSVAERGTEYHVLLKLKTAEESAEGTSEKPQATASPSRKAEFEGKRLLVAEDMAVNARIVSMQLESLGFEIETAKNGLLALKMINSHESGYYSCVIMDIQMPVMNGYEASRKIRSLPDVQKAQIPIIAMTANAFSEDVAKSYEAGMNAHISKPLDIYALTNILRRELKQEQS